MDAGCLFAAPRFRYSGTPRSPDLGTFPRAGRLVQTRLRFVRPSPLELARNDCFPVGRGLLDTPRNVFRVRLVRRECGLNQPNDGPTGKCCQGAPVIREEMRSAVDCSVSCFSRATRAVIEYCVQGGFCAIVTQRGPTRNVSRDDRSSSSNLSIWTTMRNREKVPWRRRFLLIPKPGSSSFTSRSRT